MRETVLFFDLDGTLMVNPFNKIVFPAAMAKLSALSGRAADTLLADVLAENRYRMAAVPYENAAWVMDWDDILQTVAHRSGVPNGAIPTTLCEDLARQHAAPPDTATLDDAVSALRALKAAHRRLVVATMGLSKYQFPVMRALGLYELFDDFLTPDITGYLKTERAFYAKYLDSPGERLRIHVGDNYMHDVEFPKSLGGRSILRLPAPELGVYTPFARPAHLAPYGGRIQNYPPTISALPDAVVITLAELPEVVAQIEAG